MAQDRRLAGHWKRLIGSTVALLAAGLLAPLVVPAPALDENRPLAERPQAPTGLAGLGRLRTEVDAWVADRFPARPHLIGGLNYLRLMIGVSGSPRVIVGRHGWLYLDDGTHLGAARGEVPVGAVVLGPDGRVLARAGNGTEALKDPTGHAEILAIRAACAILGAPRLPGCDLYVTLEPCALCAAAISFARIRRLYFGAYDPKGGAVEHGPRFFGQPTCHHAPEVYGGIDETPAAALLRSFFLARRA